MKTLRTPETEAKYAQYKKDLGDRLSNFNFDLTGEENVIVKEFKHWTLIKNNFPYDIIASKHDLLVSKRIFSDFDEMNDSERGELSAVKKELSGSYDFLLENLPSKMTVKKHFHIHFLKMK